MPSSYLKTADFAVYGVPSNTTPGQVVQASVLVDTYLRRPEGLVYEDDATGNPVYMKALSPTASFTISGGLTPGLNVAATLGGPTGSLQQGAIIIADKSSKSLMEPLLILSRTGNNVIIAAVTQTHAPDATYDAGLTVFESKFLPSARPLMLLTRNPIQRLLMGQGRYGYGRRGGSNNYTLNEFNMLAVMTQFGGPPIWENIDLSHTDFNPMTGEVWVPAGIMLAYYSEVRMNYICGYSQESLPDIVKLATANIINSQVSTPLNGNLKLIKAGDTQMERFLDTVLDSDTRLMLNTYRARLYA